MPVSVAAFAGVLNVINNNSDPVLRGSVLELCFFRQQQSENDLSVVSPGCVVLLSFEREAQVNNK